MRFFAPVIISLFAGLAAAQQTKPLFDPLSGQMIMSYRPVITGNHLTLPCRPGVTTTLYDSGYWDCTATDTWTARGGGAPSGSAGGDLSGTYPNPTVAKINGTSFAGTNGNLVSFGAANIPADSAVAVSTVVKGAASLTCIGGVLFQNGTTGTVTCASGFAYDSGTGILTATGISATNIIGVGSAPSISGCTGAIVGAESTQTVGYIITGATGACTVTLTFDLEAPHFWACDVSNATRANLARQSVPLSSTEATFAGTTVANDLWMYKCRAF